MRSSPFFSLLLVGLLALPSTLWAQKTRSTTRRTVAAAPSQPAPPRLNPPQLNPPQLNPANVAPKMQLEVAVSDSSTTYLVFPGPVSLVDVGQASHYLIKIETNAVFVRARRRGTPPTPILVRYGSRYWMGRLAYVNRPVLQLYDFQEGGSLGMKSGSSSSDGTGLENSLALDKNQQQRATAEAKLASLNQLRRADHQAIAVADNDLIMSLANVRNDRDFTYLRLKIINSTTIDYAVDFTDFQLVEDSKGKLFGKKKNEARRSLAPSGGAAGQTISARSTGYLLYAVPLYAATDRGHLEITLREKFGARMLLLKVPAKVINTASTI